MKFTSDRKAFAAAVSLSRDVIYSQKISMALLKNVLLNLRGDELEIHATSLASYVIYRLPVKGKTEGKILVDATALKQFLSSMSGEQVSVTLVKNKLVLESEGHKVSLDTISPEEYPDAPSVDGQAAELDVNFFDFIKQRVGFASASATEDSRPFLQGIYLDLSQKLAIGADGTRVALTQMAEDMNVPPFFIPNANMSTLRSLAIGDKIQAVIGQGFDKFETAVGTFFIAKGEDKYPIKGLLQYRTVNDKPAEAVLELDRVSLQAQLRISDYLAGASSNAGQSRGVTLRYSPKEIKLSIGVSGVGDQNDKVSGTSTGDGEILIDPKMLLDCLPLITSDVVSLKLRGLNAVFVEDSNHPEWLYYFLPLGTVSQSKQLKEQVQ